MLIGKLQMLSHDTCIDEEDCVSVLPTGIDNKALKFESVWK